MIDLKRTKQEMKEAKAEINEPDPNPFPWGTTLTFEKENVDESEVLKNARPGDKIIIKGGVARIKSVRVEDREKSDGEHTIEVQVEKIDFETMKKEKKSDKIRAQIMKDNDIEEE